MICDADVAHVDLKTDELVIFLEICQSSFMIIFYLKAVKESLLMELYPNIKPTSFIFDPVFNEHCVNPRRFSRVEYLAPGFAIPRNHVIIKA